jgi:hypothetical protein
VSGRKTLYKTYDCGVTSNPKGKKVTEAGPETLTYQQINS